VNEKTLTVYAKLGMFKTCFSGETNPYSRERMEKAIPKVKQALDNLSSLKENIYSLRDMIKNPGETDVTKLIKRQKQMRLTVSVKSRI
jgi:hypothetical protein